MGFEGTARASDGETSRWMRRGLGACITAAALSLSLASSADAKTAVPVSCGETITTDTKLANDLTDCPENGIVIGADNITLDLNGHTIDGTFVPEQCPPDCESNGVLSEGHERVTIKHGAVQEFGSAIGIVDGAGHRIRRVSMSRSGDGIDLISANRSAVTRSSVNENVFGIFVARSDRIRLTRNGVHGYQGCGVEVQRSSRVVIERDSVFANDPEGPIEGDACGIGLFNGSTLNRVVRNEVSGNGFVAVISAHGEGNRLTANHIFNNKSGVILDGDRNKVTRNHVVDTTGGCEGCGFGISFEGGRGNLIASNTVDGTQTEAGIRFAAFEPDTPPAVDNTARLNVVRGGGTDGILVESTATGTLLEGNAASDNEDDGIDVESPTTALTANRANRNGDLGIEAVPGVTDGGGNTASGNGNPLQCTNVFCG